MNLLPHPPEARKREGPRDNGYGQPLRRQRAPKGCPVVSFRVSDPSDVLDLKSAVGYVQQLTGARLHVSTLHRWALKGRLPVHRVGGKVLTTRTALRELLEADASRPPATRERREVERRGLEAAARLAEKAVG